MSDSRDLPVLIWRSGTRRHSHHDRLRTAWSSLPHAAVMGDAGLLKLVSRENWWVGLACCYWRFALLVLARLSGCTRQRASEV